jgi:DNA-binding transcriptional MerR regulator
MRIGELSRRSGIPLPTLKFYLREGLLPPGTLSARNQADYDDGHLRRLRLIRSLTEIGRLSLRSVKEVLDALDDPARSVHDLLGVAHHALGPPPLEKDDVVARARTEVDRYLRRRRGRVAAEAPARDVLAGALATLRRMGRPADVRVFDPYADAAERIARMEVSTIGGTTDRAWAVEQAVVGTVVFEAALVALRRLAQEHESAARFGRRRGPSRSLR